jgi:hypothetical protein
VKRQKLNMVMIVIYVAVLLLGFPIIEQDQLLIYSSFIIVSAVIQYAILERLSHDPLIQQNPLIILSNYLLITVAVAICGSHEGFFLEVAYLYVALFTAVYFELRVSIALSFLSIVSYGIISYANVHKTTLHSDLYHLTGIIVMTILLFSVSTVLHTSTVRSKIN